MIGRSVITLKLSDQSQISHHFKLNLIATRVQVFQNKIVQCWHNASPFAFRFLALTLVFNSGPSPPNLPPVDIFAHDDMSFPISLLNF